MAEPTCLTPCESALCLMRVYRCGCSASPSGEGLSRPKEVPCALWLCLSFGGSPVCRSLVGSPGELGRQALDTKGRGARGGALSWVVARSPDAGPSGLFGGALME